MLIVERGTGALLITLNRPEKRNALHPTLIQELAATLDEAEADDRVRVVVLTGAGNSFCAGLDLDQLSRMGEDDRVEYMRSAFDLFRRVHELRQPVVAAVNGPAVAGGFDLAAFCDLRFCAPEARFAQAEIRLGLTQIMYPLHLIIGLGRAKELALTGDAISAQEAHRIGLVNRVIPREELVAETLRIADAIASRPPHALYATRALSREVIQMDTETAMTRMLDVISVRLRSQEHRGALRSHVAHLRAGRSGPAAAEPEEAE